MMRRDDEIRIGGRLSRFGHGSREDRRLSLREREALRRKAREAEDEDLDEDEEDDEDYDGDEEDEDDEDLDDEEDEDEEDYDGDEEDDDDDDEEDDEEEDEDEEDEDELDDDNEDDDEDDDLDDENESDEEDEDDRDDDDEDSYEPSPAPSKPVSSSDDRDAYIAAYLAEKERELALEREATERAEKEERERQEREESARREEQARAQAEEDERARRAEKAEIARRAREAEDRASTEDRLGRTRAPFNGTEGYRGIEDSLDRVSPVSGRSGGSQRESYAGREPVLSESDRALRERELALKEREIALKERELALREREQQLKSAGSHSGKSSSVSPASYTTRVINGKTVKVKDTGKKVSKPIEEPVALSQDNRSKRYEGLSDESLMKEVTAFMLRYGVKKHGIPYELMAEEFGAGLIAKLIIRGHLVRLGDSTLTCGNN